MYSPPPTIEQLADATKLPWRIGFDLDGEHIELYTFSGAGAALVGEAIRLILDKRKGP